jgi:hypothetical protein
VRNNSHPSWHVTFDSSKLCIRCSFQCFYYYVFVIFIHVAKRKWYPCVYFDLFVIILYNDCHGNHENNFSLKVKTFKCYNIICLQSLVRLSVRFIWWVCVIRARPVHSAMYEVIVLSSVNIGCEASVRRGMTASFYTNMTCLRCPSATSFLSLVSDNKCGISAVYNEMSDTCDSSYY